VSAALGKMKGTLMDIEKMRRQLEALPPEAQRQVADFIAFLYARHRRSLLPKRSIKSKLAEEPFVGLWEDREDLRDSTAWVRHVRQREWGS
jgi:small-conductance mechanosensitive channel